MIVINSIDDKYFSLDGIRFARIYQGLAQGSQAIGIYSIYDTKQQVVNSTKFNEFQINGVVYPTQEATIAALLDVIWSSLADYDVEQLEGRVENLEENQYSGVVVYSTYAELPATGTLLVSYKVSNDPTSSINGYYHWDGAEYIKDASLNNGEIEAGSLESVQGGKIYSYFNEEIDASEDFIVNDAYVKASPVELVDPFVDFNVKKYKVKQGQFIRVYGQKRGSNVLTVGLFSSDVVNSENLIEAKEVTNNINPETLDISFTVQAGVEYLIVSNDEALSLLVDITTDLLGRITKLEGYHENLVLLAIEEISSSFILGSDGEVQAGFPDYKVQVFEIEEGELYQVLGACRGNDVLVAGFYSSNAIGAGTLIEKILVINDNAVDTEVNIAKVAPENATHIAITKYVNADLQVLRTNELQVQVSELEERVGILEGQSLNSVVEQMTECDNELSQTYPSYFIDMKKEMNNRGVTYKNIIASFVVPSVDSSVDIALDGISSLSVGEEVYVGTKQKQDKYEIVALLGGNVVTFKLIESNLNLIGVTVPVSSIDSPIRVYEIADIDRYNSNVFMLPLIRDKYHPTDDGFNLAGDIFSEKIKKQLPSVANLYLFGDSFCDDPYPLAARIAVNLGITTSGYDYGFKSQRIEYIYDQFETFISTYAPVAGDFFLFWMGTNNLADIHRNPSDKLEQVLNLSYRDMFLIIAGKISELLPLGNYVIATGFGNTDYY